MHAVVLEWAGRSAVFKVLDRICVGVHYPRLNLGWDADVVCDAVCSARLLLFARLQKSATHSRAMVRPYHQL